MTSLYALGWTQHSVGSQNIRAIACIQLLLGQHGRARRRNQRAARPLQHPGAHRPRRDVAPLARLPRLPHREGAEPQDLPGESHPQAAAARPDELLAELPQVLHLAAQGLVRDGGHQEERLRLRLSAQERQDVRHPHRGPSHVPGQGERLLLSGLQPAGLGPRQGEAHRGVLQAQVPGGHRPAGHRDVHLLEEPGRVQRRRSRQDPDRGLPPPVDLLRRRGRLAGEQRPLAAVALQGGRPAGRGQGRRRRSSPRSSCGCGPSTRRRAGPSPIRSSRCAWPYKIPRSPSPGGAGQGIQRLRARRCPRPQDPSKFLVREGEQVPGFGVLQADGSTACGCWIFAGCWTQAGNQMARRDPSDPTGLGQHARAGPGPGRPTGASSTTGPRPTRRASPGTRTARFLFWTGKSGAAPTCRTCGRTPRPRRA